MKSEQSTDFMTERPLEERKLGYVHLNNGAQPRSQSSVRLFIELVLDVFVFTPLFRSRETYLAS